MSTIRLKEKDCIEMVYQSLQKDQDIKKRDWLGFDALAAKIPDEMAELGLACTSPAVYQDLPGVELQKFGKEQLIQGLTKVGYVEKGGNGVEEYRLVVAPVLKAATPAMVPSTNGSSGQSKLTGSENGQPEASTQKETNAPAHLTGGSNGAAEAKQVGATGLHRHPLAARIVPLMATEEFDALKQSVARIGPREPVITFEGKVVDHWHLDLACKAVGCTPQTQDLVLPDGMSLLDHIIAKLVRRDLTKSQRACVAVEAEAEYAKLAKQRQREHGKTAPGRGKNTSGNNSGSDGEAREQAGKELGVNTHFVSDAKKLKSKKPDLFQKVFSGGLKLSEAIKQAFPKGLAMKRTSTASASSALKGRADAGAAIAPVPTALHVPSEGSTATALPPVPQPESPTADFRSGKLNEGNLAEEPTSDTRVESDPGILVHELDGILGVSDIVKRWLQDKQRFRTLMNTLPENERTGYQARLLSLSSDLNMLLQ